MNIALIAGSGFEKYFQKNSHPKIINTDFGVTHLYQAHLDEIDFWFLPRHGMAHHLPPHKINYRANIAALKQIGIEKTIALFTVGSINPKYKVNSFTIVDQYIDMSHRQDSTFYQETKDQTVKHMQMNRPYCDTLRKKLIEYGENSHLNIHSTGTYICTNGPQLETPAEINFYRMIGADLVGMTGFPEVALAREANIHYAAIAYSVNWAAGMESQIELIDDDLQKQKIISIAIKTLAITTHFKECECKEPSL